MEYIPHNWEAHHRWNAERGDETHRLDYPLTQNSIVFDVGGYKGEWAQQIHNRYKSKIYVFEPVLDFALKIKEKFTNQENVRVFGFGLGVKDEFININLDGDGSSTVQNISKPERIQIKSILNFLEENKIEKVDLIKINIEAAEYELLEDILLNDKAHLFDNIQVQFHTFIPDCVERRNKIREGLSKTHSLTYDFTFIWENWKQHN